MLAIDCLVHFEYLAGQRAVEAWRLLLLDGNESPSTPEFIEFHEKNKILPFCFPSHCTYVLQPLDIVVFQFYQQYHAQTIDSPTRSGCCEFDKIECLNGILIQFD